MARLAGITAGPLLALVAILVAQSERVEARVRAKIEARATAALGAPVHIGSLQIRLATFRPRIEACDVSVELPGEETIEARCATIFLQPLQLVAREVDLEQVEIDALRVKLDLDGGAVPALRANGAKPAGGVRVGAVVLKRGTLDLAGAGLELGLDEVDGLLTMDAGATVLDVRSKGRHIRGRLGAGTIDEPIGSFEGQIVLRGDAVEIRSGRFETGSVSLHVDAAAALDGSRIAISRLDATAPLELFPRLSSSLAAVPGWTGTVGWNGPVSFDENGLHAAGALSIAAGPQVRIGGTVTLDGVSGHAELAHAGIVAGRTRIPDGTLSGDFSLDQKGIALHDGFASSGKSRLTFDGVISRDGQTDFTFEAAPLALHELSPIEGVEVAGTGPVTGGRITGPVGALLVEGDVELAAFRVAGLDVGDGAGPVRLSFAEPSIASPGTRFVRGATGWAGAWRVAFAEGGRLEVGSRERPITITGGRVEDLLGIGVVTLPIAASGELGEGSLWLAGPFHALDGAFVAKGRALDVSEQRFSNFQVRGRLDAGAVWLDDVVARRDSGAQLFARGRIGATPNRSLALELHVSACSLADIDRAAGHGVTSSLAAQLRIGGTLAEPDVRGTVRFDDTRVGDRAIGDSRLTLLTESGAVRIGGSLASGALTPDGSVKLDLSAADLTLLGRKGEKLSVTAQPVNGQWEANARGTVDLGLAALATGRLSRAEGVLDVKSFLYWGGHYRGEADVRASLIEARSFPLPATGTTAKLSLEDGVVSIRALSGAIGGGSFDLARETSLVLDGLACVSRFDGAVELTAVTMRYPSQSFTGRVSGPLQVEGSNCGESLPKLSGELILEQAKYRGTPGGSSASSRAAATRASVALDIGLSAPGGNIFVKNDLVSAELATKTALRLTGNDTAWGIAPGTLGLIAGKLFVQGVAFELRKADIEFVDARTIDAKYSITAVKRLGFWDLTVNATGQLSQGAPKVDLESSPPLSDDDARDLLEKTRLRERIQLRAAGL